jgi:hypothetical protein
LVDNFEQAVGEPVSEARVAALARAKLDLARGVVLWADAVLIPWALPERATHMCVVVSVEGSPPTHVRLVPGTKSAPRDPNTTPVVIAPGELGEPRQVLTTYFVPAESFPLDVSELRTGADGREPTFCTSRGRFSEQRMRELDLWLGEGP